MKVGRGGCNLKILIAKGGTKITNRAHVKKYVVI